MEEPHATITIRPERPGDSDAIRKVNDQAFEEADEALLVERLRAHDGVLCSLVAECGGEIVGHILYSPVSLGEGAAAISGAGLGPIAVLPAFQRQGIGGRLIRAGVEQLRAEGCPFIVVLGHPDYYPRFGFTPASGHGVYCQWEVPEEAFMLLVLDEARMQGARGLARYRAEFSELA